MPPKGTSEEEKKQKLIQHMYDTGNIYNNSTIENASKITGISAMIIKNIVQSIADEGLIDTDRIGASTYYWFFKSKKSQVLQSQNKQLQQKITDYNTELHNLTTQCEQLKKQKEKSSETDQLAANLKQLKEEYKTLNGKLANYQQFGFENYTKLQELLEKVKQDCNIETDNIFALRRFLENKFSMERKACNTQLHITDDFDYIE